MNLKKFEKTQYPNIYKNRQNGTYAIDISLGRDLITGKRLRTTRTGILTEREAKKILSNEKTKSKMKLDLVVNQPIDVVFSEYTNKMKNSLREKTLYSKITMFNRYILPNYKNYLVNKIDKILLLDIKNHINTFEVSNVTKNNVLVAFKAFIKYCYVEGYIDDNPCDKVDNFKIIKKEKKYFTLDEFKRFISKVNKEPYKTLFTILYLTGARRGEILASIWSDYDYNTKTLNIKKSITFVPTIGYLITEPKNEQSKRIIQLDDNCCRLLNSLKDKMKPNEEDFIFVNKLGNILRFETIRQNFKRAITKAGLHEIRLHDLRHSHVALLIKKDFNIGDIGERIGHTNKTTTMNVYGHWCRENQIKIADNLSNIDI